MPLFPVELPRRKFIIGYYMNAACKRIETHRVATRPSVHTPLIKRDPCPQPERNSSGSRAGSGCPAGEARRAHLHSVTRSHRGTCLHRIIMLLLVPLIASAPKCRYGQRERLKNPDALLSFNVFSFPQNITIHFWWWQPWLRYLSREKEVQFIWYVLAFFSSALKNMNRELGPQYTF